MKKAVYHAVIFFWVYGHTFAQIGIGTNNPQAQLDVDNGTVKFSSYGNGTIIGTEQFLLGVENDGDIIEIPLNKGLQYHTWDIVNTTQPNIGNKRTLGISTSQGILNNDMNDAALLAIAPDADGFIVRYSGILRVKNTGTFTLNARTNDGSRVFIDDILVIENWTDNPPPLATVSGSITLAEGEHKIEFWYYENFGTISMLFTWGTNPDSYVVGSTINANQFFVK
ncbi:PA14 domain-containing protein [Flavivirga eckloniae]|uniref:PA14 domain-containing protein n=1 Tax=Flavivirga eckloniae TaxID=1803846 RepID=A0A2K9PTM5_9FLAO|nr:PA14 domain-containing protein [Flavivirga eckloniae]AUP80416.1 hypothetical protein C1H87_17540 [Flavivirga eckloniae]